MSEKIVWVDGIVDRTKPKAFCAYAVVKIPVSVREVTARETVPFATVTPGRSVEPDVRSFDIVENAGRLWRPIDVKLSFHEEMPSGEEVISKRGRDNPLLIASHSRQAQTFHKNDEAADAKFADKGQEAVLARKLAEIAQDLLLVDGIAYRTCEEPTWIVTKAKGWNQGVLVQPFCGKPGKAKDAVWFNFNRKEEALAFAAEVAARENVEVVARGSAEILPGGATAFDDVTFAENRLSSDFLKAARLLAPTLPEEVEDMIQEARGLNGPHRAAAAMKIAAALEPMRERADVAALLDAATLQLAQCAYFHKNAILSPNDEDALDALLLPKP